MPRRPKLRDASGKAPQAEATAIPLDERRSGRSHIQRNTREELAETQLLPMNPPRPDGCVLTPFLVSKPHAARLLAISVRAFERLIAAGKGPAPVRIGRSVRWKIADITTWLDQQGQGKGEKRS